MGSDDRATPGGRRRAVVIVGGGCGGLTAAHELHGADGASVEHLPKQPTAAARA
jgi:cation diffusion facilitator CzcD-associated flavoprotein CzcO